MRVTIKLEGKTITQKEAKEILGEERFERYKFEAEAGFWASPVFFLTFPPLLRSFDTAAALPCFPGVADF